MNARRKNLGVFPLVCALVVAAAIAFAGPTPTAAAPAAPATPAGAVPRTQTGTSPMPNDVAIPTAWLPPAPTRPTRGPARPSSPRSA